MSIVGYSFQQRFYEATMDACLIGTQLSVALSEAGEIWAVIIFNMLDPAKHISVETDV